MRQVPGLIFGIGVTLAALALFGCAGPMRAACDAVNYDLTCATDPVHCGQRRALPDDFTFGR